MEDHRVSFETAKLAKDKGFNISTISAYIGEELFENKVDVSNSDFSGYNIFIKIDEFHKDWNIPGWIFTKEGEQCFGPTLDNKYYFEAYCAPTQSLLQKWLREVHNINISVSIMVNPQYDGWNIEIRNGRKFHYSNICKSSYESALEIGLFEALKLIK